MERFDVFTDEFFEIYIRPSTKYEMSHHDGMTHKKLPFRSGLCRRKASFEETVTWVKKACWKPTNIYFPNNAINAKLKQAFVKAILL